MNKIKEIPKNWREETLGDLGVCIRGVTYGPGDLLSDPKNGVSLLRSNNINQDGFNFDDVNIVCAERVSGEQILRTGDVFICMSNGSRHLVGKNVAVEEDGNMTVGAFCAIFRPRQEVAARFVAQFFKSEAYIKQIHDALSGTNINNLKKSDIEELKLFVPEKKEEQKRIAEILGAVDEEIEKTDQLISTTEKLKKGLMQQLLTRGIGHTKFKKTKLGLIPVEWEIAKFSDIASLRSEKMNPKNGINQKYIGLEHIDQESGLLLGFGDSTSTQSLKAIFKTGDILFGKLRPYLRKFWHAKFDGVCTTEVLVFIPKEAGDGNFVYQLVQTDEFIENSHSKSFGTKMPRTDWSIIADFQFPLPSIEERKKIGQILSAVDDKITVSKHLKEKLTTLKKGLMQDLLSGMKRVLL